MALTSIPASGAKLRGAVLSSLITEVRELYVSKGSDESVTSSTTLQNDDELLLAIAANATYVGSLNLAATSAANAAGDIHIAFSFPTGATLHFLGIGPDPALASGSKVLGEFLARLSATSGSTDISYGLSQSTMLTIYVPIIIANGANAGNLQLMWAQQSSNANASTVKAGSYMRLKRVA